MNLKRQVRRYTQAAAERFGVSADDILNMKRGRACLHARYYAIRKILRYTGCSQAQLAEAWGIDPSSVKAATREVRPLRKFAVTGEKAASEALLAKLTWQYGVQRAAAIMAGKDPRTQADIERWNSIGRRAAA